MTQKPFQPILLLGNPHLQTVLGSLIKGPRFHAPTRVVAVPLPDGDAIAVHDSIPSSWVSTGPIAVIVHGMGGSARSAYTERTAGRFWRLGWRVVRIDLRGAGAGVSIAKGIYHAGVSDDVRAVVEWLALESPLAPVTLVGFSLGGNIVLKLAGEAVDNPLPNLARVAALAPPIDLLACAELISHPRNRFYDRKFIRDLVMLASEHHRRHPYRPLPHFPERMTVRQFDDLYTSPRGGFLDSGDYYRRSSSVSLIPRINVPSLLLTARDDPFIAVEPFESLQVAPHVRVVITERGGHLGFLGPDGQGGRRWAESQIIAWASDRQEVPRRPSRSRARNS